MAPRWTPKADEPVGSREHIGRRTFDEPMLTGAQNQPPWDGIDIRHFEARDGELSIDRLGQNGTDGRVVNYLRPKAAAAGLATEPPKSFDGWLVVSAKYLAGPRSVGRYKLPPVTPSPIATPGSNENPYHGHITFPAEEPADFVTLKLRYTFGKYGFLMQPDGSRVPIPGTEPRPSETAAAPGTQPGQREGLPSGAVGAEPDPREVRPIHDAKPYAAEDRQPRRGLLARLLMRFRRPS